MRPLTLAERMAAPASVSVIKLLEGDRPNLVGETPVTIEDYVDEILASGFPGLRGISDRALCLQLDAISSASSIGTSLSSATWFVTLGD